MIAGLLYISGFIAVVITVMLAVVGAPDVWAVYQEGMALAGAESTQVAIRAAALMSWAVVPFVGGLVLMGFGRMLFLLGAINHALRE